MVTGLSGLVSRAVLIDCARYDRETKLVGKVQEHSHRAGIEVTAFLFEGEDEEDRGGGEGECGARVRRWAQRRHFTPVGGRCARPHNLTVSCVPEETPVTGYWFALNGGEGGGEAVVRGKATGVWQRMPASVVSKIDRREEEKMKRFFESSYRE